MISILTKTGKRPGRIAVSRQTERSLLVNEMKASEVRAMSVAELNTKLDALKKDLFMLRMQHATNQLDNPQKLVQTKRDIARVKTMIREKEEK